MIHPAAASNFNSDRDIARDARSVLLLVLLTAAALPARGGVSLSDQNLETDGLFDLVTLDGKVLSTVGRFEVNVTAEDLRASDRSKVKGALVAFINENRDQLGLGADYRADYLEVTIVTEAGPDHLVFHIEQRTEDSVRHLDSE